MTAYANRLVNDLGFYPISVWLELLEAMEILSQAIMFLGLVFDIIILLFIILSILLIYSLLMISVESKTFEFGVMRMQGLSKSGIVMLILLQSVMFVAPSVLLGFILSVPTLSSINRGLFTEDMGVHVSNLPSRSAVFQAIVVGLLIPFCSSIAPI